MKQLETNDAIVRLLGVIFLKKQNLPDWAIAALEYGFDSRSLRMLASMNDRDSASELHDYLNRAMIELGWNDLSRPKLLLRYSQFIAVEIIEDKVDPLIASRVIYEILVDLDSPWELMDWYEIDEMIWCHEYFIKTGEKDYYFRERDELVLEIKTAAAKLAQESLA